MKNSVLKMVMIGVAALCATVSAAEMPRSEWQAKVGECAQNAEKLQEIIGQLSDSDQVAFLAEVNKAIEKMPGSDDVKGARFYAANRAAVIGCSKSNRAAVLAEVFATVPPENLTTINERFASELFNRDANPSRKFTDAEMTALSKKSMEGIIERCEKAENGGVRSMFAILMFVRASNGSPADLADTLMSQLPDEKTRAMAKNEWYKSAMGIDQPKSYDSILGSAGAGDEPNHSVVLRLSGMQSGIAVLADLQTVSADPKASSSAGIGRGLMINNISLATMPDSGINRVPTPAVSNPDSPYYSSGREPGAYRGQKAAAKFKLF